MIVLRDKAKTGFDINKVRKEFHCVSRLYYTGRQAESLNGKLDISLKSVIIPLDENE